MWGHILTEASTQQNFNFGFSTYKSEILVHLSQWQYWWWFWFSIWWSLYFFIIFRTMSKRTFNFNVTMNTSLRGRGKWGDFLVALIPVSWCCNILINSNFILRMIEWQNESSLFTIRIQGKQWYWVYKYDPNTAQAVMTTPKNIGHNRWRVVSGQESYNADTYYQAIHLAAQLEFQDSYSSFTKKIDTHRKTLNVINLVNDKTNIATHWQVEVRQPAHLFEPIVQQFEDSILTDQQDNSYNFNIEDIGSERSNSIVLSTAIVQEFDSNVLLEQLTKNYFSNTLSSNKPVHTKLVNSTLHDIFYTSDYFTESIFKAFFSNNFNAYYEFLQLDETSDTDSNSRHFLTTQPFRLIKGVLNYHVVDILQHEKFISEKLQKNLLFTTKIISSGELLKDKELMPETLWGFRQKKYKRMKKFKFKPEVVYDPVTFEVSGEKKMSISPKLDIAGLSLLNLDTSSSNFSNQELLNFKSKTKDLNDNFNYRLAAKINRHRSELVPVTLARRLLRTKRTLVLPAHVNLTVITNSYDVVHSWFVPGLGLKLDCVPGRSTHHTFYIDNIGFYYGQCAEICGRYHHHMPIRLCALPFEHFVVWWHAKGTARMNRTVNINANKYLQTKFNNIITRDKLIFRMN